MRALLYVEIEVRVCQLTYGTAPCTAGLGVTGAIKCFKTPATCQSRPNIDEQMVTLRFGFDSGFLPREIECRPSLLKVDFTPATISLGEDLGQRASVTASFRDGPHPDVGPGFDPHVTERDYDPYQRGTFWGKFQARHPYIQGNAFRVIRGFLPDSFDAVIPQGTPLPDGVLIEQDTRHYTIDELDVLKPEAGTVDIIAKDILKLADSEKALCPKPSSGSLVADISAVAATLTLTPAGVGNSEYPANGKGVIAGQEIVPFTRVGDVITMTARGADGTEAQTHSAGDRFQLMYIATAVTPAAFLDDIFTNYAAIDPSFIPRADWDTELSTYLNRSYSIEVAEPTSVNDLAAGVIKQAVLAVWQDDSTKQINLLVLRPVPSDAEVIDDSLIVVDNKGLTTLRANAQPDKRVSESYTWFGQRNPVEGASDQKNYRSARGAVSAVAEANWGVPAISQVLANMIPVGGAAAADRYNTIVLSRFANPPRHFEFNMYRRARITPRLGGMYWLSAPTLQDATGARMLVPIMVTRLNPQQSWYEVEAEEALGGATVEDLSSRTLTIDTDTMNVDLLAYHNLFYPPPVTGDTFTLTLTIEAGVTVGSTSTAIPSLLINSWPAGVTINVENNGTIEPAGGAAGVGGSFSNGSPGQPGGTALFTRRAINLLNALGKLYGGGGGGGGGGAFSVPGLTAGGSGGGGGRGVTAGAGAPPGASSAGCTPGTAGTNASAAAPGVGGPATGSELTGLNLSGSGGNGGDAGSPGSPGGNATQAGHQLGAVLYLGGAGGAAGPAIDGISHVTIVSAGDIRGPEIN